MSRIKAHGRSHRVTVAVALLIILVAGVLTTLSITQYYASLSGELFRERQVNMTEYGTKSAQMAETIVNDHWQYTATLAALAGTEEITRQEDTLSAAAWAGAFLNDEEVTAILFDTKGMYYTSSGRKGKWTELSMLTKSAADRQAVIMTLPYENADTQQLVFLRRLPETEKIGGRQINFVGIAVQMEVFSGKLEVEAFGGEGLLYIMGDDGRRLYRYTGRDLLTAYNLLTETETLPITGCTHEELRAALTDRTGVSGELTISDEGWFFALEPIGGTDWSLLMLVPEDVLGANTANMLDATNRFFARIAAMLVILAVMIVILIMVSRNARRRAETERRHAEALTQLNSQLEVATEEARSASAAKTDFLSNMSHDIRTPINGIMGMTTIGLKSAEEEDWSRVKDCLRKIDGSSRHLLSLVNDVLDMSRIESGKTVANHEPFDLRELCDNCASIIGGQLTSRDVKLIREAGPFEHPAVIGDALHLRQIFINILGNSVKFTPDGGSITFRAKETAAADGRAHYVFELEDTGIGMKPEFLPHLFEAFTQEDGGTRTTYKGTGLGMAITKQLVGILGGTIEVESTLGVGTRFVIGMDMDIDPNARVTQADEAPEELNIEGMRILLAEDNDLNREIAVDLLEDAGATVTEAENGQIALETFVKADPGSFDAVLMDVMMPVLGGYDATRAIRASGKADAATIPIIAMTANAFDEDIRKALDSGMNAHLAKPIDVHMLIKTLSNFRHHKEE